jgi:hypothetical protein
MHYDYVAIGDLSIMVWVNINSIIPINQKAKGGVLHRVLGIIPC